MKRIVLLLLFLLLPSVSLTQVEAPESRYIFEEDNPKIEEREKRQLKQIIASDTSVKQGMDFKAPQIEYLEKSKEMKGSGGVLITQGGLFVQADEVLLNTESQDASLGGNVLFTTPEAEIASKSATLNMDTETGSFFNATTVFEEGGYKLLANDFYKDSDFEYRAYDSIFSTCHCADGELPWKLTCKSTDIEVNGYAKAKHALFQFHGVPLFYTPYLAFPVKVERQSGVLAPTYGYGNQDGIQLSVPIFGVIDDHTDFTLRPFIETQSRIGSSFEFRKIFSMRHSIDTRFYLSDESRRDGSLRGTNITGLEDGTFDEERIGGYYKHYWQSEPNAYIPSSFSADIRYVSDDLFLREIEDQDIGRYNSRYATSKALLRSQFGDYVYGEVAAEYNQDLLRDDDLVFQRLPTATLNAKKSFRPFGFNPYGLKLVAGASLGATDFYRGEGYEGQRFDFSPSAKVPFHFKNYFNGEASVTGHQTNYNLSNNIDPSTNTEVTGDERTTADVNFKISTAVEKVMQVPEDSFLASFASYGIENQDLRLKRVKHTIEPFLNYRYIPDTDQDLNPRFDSYDRLNNLSVFTYGFKTSLLGRFTSQIPGQEKIAELTPEVRDLPTVPDSNLFGNFSFDGIEDSLSPSVYKVNRGNVRELANLYVRQSFDYLEQDEDRNPNQDPLSDIGIDLGIFPTRNFGMKFQTNMNPNEGGQLSSWRLGAHFRDDRGDIIRAQYRFVDNAVSQIVGNVEIAITDRLKLGGYGRYDDVQNEFLESRAALRLVSACNCWSLDFGVSERINPNRTQAFLTLSLRGLGALTQSFGFGKAGAGVN